MPSYLVESYLERSHATDGADHGETARRVRAAADDLSDRGIPVRFERSITVPEDELCLVVVHAPSVAAALLAARTAGLEPVRVVEAVTSAPGDAATNP